MPNSDSERFSPLLLARIVGILGVAGIVTGAFDIGYVQSKLMVAGNVSATLQNILAHQTLFRVGFSAHLFELLLNILAEIISFYLFRRVNVLVAAVSLCAGMIGIAVEASRCSSRTCRCSSHWRAAPWRIHSRTTACLRELLNAVEAGGSSPVMGVLWAR